MFTLIHIGNLTVNTQSDKSHIRIPDMFSISHTLYVPVKTEQFEKFG